MTVLCSAGCFCYYRGNDTQWMGAGACGIRLQLKERITAVRMNPNSSSLFHNLKISWGFGVSGNRNPSWEGVVTARLMLFLSSSTWFFYKDQTAPIQHRIYPISGFQGSITMTGHLNHACWVTCLRVAQAHLSHSPDAFPNMHPHVHHLLL